MLMAKGVVIPGGRSVCACRLARRRQDSVRLPPLYSAVSVPVPPSIRSLSSPWFQIMPNIVAGLADILVVLVAAGQDVIVGAAEQQVEVLPRAKQDVVAGLAEQQSPSDLWVKSSLPALPNRVAVGHEMKPSSKGSDDVVVVEAEGLDACTYLRCRRARRSPGPCRRRHQNRPGGVPAEGDGIAKAIAENRYALRAGEGRSL